MSWLFIGWWTTGQLVLYVLTYRAWAICAEVWMSYSYTWNGVHLKRGCEKFDICGEMNPFGIFYIGRSEFGFHRDDELNRDG